MEIHHQDVRLVRPAENKSTIQLDSLLCHLLAKEGIILRLQIQIDFFAVDVSAGQAMRQAAHWNGAKEDSIKNAGSQIGAKR